MRTTSAREAASYCAEASSSGFLSVVRSLLMADEIGGHAGSWKDGQNFVLAGFMAPDRLREIAAAQWVGSIGGLSNAREDNLVDVYFPRRVA